MSKLETLLTLLRYLQRKATYWSIPYEHNQTVCIKKCILRYVQTCGSNTTITIESNI